MKPITARGALEALKLNIRAYLRGQIPLPVFTHSTAVVAHALRESGIADVGPWATVEEIERIVQRHGGAILPEREIRRDLTGLILHAE